MLELIFRLLTANPRLCLNARADFLFANKRNSSSTQTEYIYIHTRIVLADNKSAVAFKPRGGCFVSKQEIKFFVSKTNQP